MKRPLQFAGIALIALVIIVGLFALRQLGNDTPAALPTPSLKELARRHDLELGNFAMEKLLDDPTYRDILTNQFELATIDNIPNWHFTDYDLRPSRDKYNFDKIDKVVAFAKQHDMPMQGHHYLWGEEKWLPNWLVKGNYTKEQLSEIMHDHIDTVGKRYAGTIGQWTVVNEAFSRKTHIYDLEDWWADHTGGGTEYIDNAFIWARQADPNAVLILNDFNNESKNDISDNMYTYIKDAKARGIPIDAIGMQMHIDGSHPPVKDEVISNMRRFGDLGVKVYVTEFDVNMHDVPAEEDDRDKIQEGIYYDMLRACIESKNCPSFAYLGITDKETWYNYVGLGDARPLPFDKHYDPKPAYYGIRRALEQE